MPLENSFSSQGASPSPFLWPKYQSIVVYAPSDGLSFPRIWPRQAHHTQDRYLSAPFPLYVSDHSPEQSAYGLHKVTD